MSLVALFNNPLQILRHSDGAEDDYGNAAETFTAGETVLGRLEQRSGVEVTLDRQTYVSDWVFYTHSSTTMSVRDRGADVYGRVFEVLSLAQQPGRNGPHHLEVLMRHVDG